MGESQITFYGLGETFDGMECWWVDWKGIRNFILVSINFVPAAKLAPDKGTSIIWQISITSKGYWNIPSKECYPQSPSAFYVQISMLDREAFFLFVSPPLPQTSSQCSHSIFLPHGTQSPILPPGSVWKGILLLPIETAVATSEISLGQGKWNLISGPHKYPSSSSSLHFGSYPPPQAHSCRGECRRCLVPIRKKERKSEGNTGRKRRLSRKRWKAAGVV